MHKQALAAMYGDQFGNRRLLVSVVSVISGVGHCRGDSQRIGSVQRYYRRLVIVL